MSNIIQPLNTNDGKIPIRKVQTLGSVRQRDEHTNEIILIPTPSQDPNDPLNWLVSSATREVKFVSATNTTSGARGGSTTWLHLFALRCSCAISLQQDPASRS